MPSEMSISTLVISDVYRFIGMEDFWNQQVRDHVDDPFLSGCMLDEHWRVHQRFGWHPFVMIFLSGGRIVGFAPLLMRPKFGFRHACNSDQYTLPDFFSDDYREVCVDKMIDFLFRQFNCESINITFEDSSANQRMLEKVCRSRNYSFSRLPQEGAAIIPIKTSLESFRESMDTKVRKEFRRIGRKLDGLGSWQISCSNFDRSSAEKIWTIEKFSWKNNLLGKEKAIKTQGLKCILSGVRRNDEGDPFFKSEIWLLDLDDTPIAYVLVMKRNKTVFFAKTSFDSRFREVSPGRFLMNDLIERFFKERSAEKIDFMSNLPVLRVWKPLVRRRITFRIERNPVLSRAHRLIFKNRISCTAINFLECLKWKKLYP